MFAGSTPPVLSLRPPPSPPKQGQTSPTDTNVLSRLHALFNAHSHDESAHDGGQGLSRAKTAPITSPQLISPGTIVDREAIKVLVVTWNMGDALPKGDLSVLLGHVPQYTAPPSPSPGLPTLPVEDSHPYHIVVIAGQECPTDSGVPRGLGGIMKGVHVRHRKEKEERRKEKEREKEEESSSNAQETGKDDEPKTPNVETDEDVEDDSRGPSPSTPTTATIPHKHTHPATSKGWSMMLDDWFCGIVPSTDKAGMPALTPSPGHSPGIPGQSPSGNPPLASPFPPSLIRSPSDPILTLPTEPLHIPIKGLAAPAFAHSPSARSASSSSSSSSSTTPDEPTSSSNLPTPRSPDIPGQKSASMPIKQDRPAIVIPNNEPDRTRNGEKCYSHLVKERSMGMYSSVYVYKGCEHSIQGVDKDFVTAGLAGGRLGNKGGIGISLKLADHRFLFVNSHLAAHSTRVSARSANIAKIKAELRSDTFSPKDDPKNLLPDITDRFDTVFWCGDLNFRLELSRLHAEWLVEQKKYSEALMWDQLKTVMKDPEKNPFPGFEEHTIDFPPTFKYDVWRSIKATNRELKRSLRRRGTLEGRNARRPSSADISPASVPSPNAGLSHVPEAEAHEESGHALSADRFQEVRNSDDDVRTIASRRSFESTAGGYTSAVPSTAGTDAEDEDFATSVDASAYGSRHRAFEAAIKAKTKNSSSLVKMDKVLSPSPSTRRRLGRSGSKSVKEKPVNDFDFDSRRTSISSIGSLEPAPAFQEYAVARPSISSTRPSVLPLGGPRRPSDASFLSSSPNQPITRRFSMLKRTVSGRSTTDGRSLESHELSIDDIDENADNREGVYDTSKKQRVPSWCDRVLWKTQVTPDPEASPDSSQVQGEGPAERGNRTFNRLSHAFANSGGHLRLSMTRTGSSDTQYRSNVHTDRPLPPTPPPENEVRRITSPAAGRSPAMTRSPEEMESLQPLPGGQPSRSLSRPSKLSIRTRSGSATHPSLDANSVLASPPAHPKITFDPALPRDADRPGSVQPRPRANSDSIPNEMSKIKRTFSSSSNTARVSPPRAGELRRSSGGSPRATSQIPTADPPNLSPVARRPSNPNQLSSRSIGSSHHSAEHRSSFVTFFRDLPGLSHVKSSPNHDSEELPGRHEADEFRTRRHFRGEVACLHYGTIDDAGMRQSEGRSDHRPAIFSAAVYVGD